MTLLELGIFQDQVLVITRNYHQIPGVPELETSYKRQHLISIIKQMAEQIFHGNFSQLGGDQFVVYFESYPSYKKGKAQPRTMIVAVSDKNSDPKIVKMLLKNLLDEFLEYHPVDEPNVKDMSSFIDFSNRIDSVLKDERLSPVQRVVHALF
jgi:hypothetical protein